MLTVNVNSLSILSDESKRLLLKDLNFKIEYGFIYTVLGKNGSGKSTLIKALTKLLINKNYEVIGRVILGDIDLLTANENALREIRKKKIRYVFQDTINSFDPLKKLGYYFKYFAYDKLKAEELLEYFLLPGYDKLKEMYPYELSGGMVQRLSLIFALLAEPGLIILDEPTSGIDYASSNLVLLKLKEFVKDGKRSVLVVTQDLNFASAASDYIAMISNNNLTPFKTSKDFFSSILSEEQSSLLSALKEVEE